MSSDNFKQLWIPEGFLHGFLVLSEYANVLYLCAMILKYHGDNSIKQIVGTDGQQIDGNIQDRTETSDANITID